MERKTILAIVVLAVLALATRALVWVLSPNEEGKGFVGPSRSDYTLTNFTLDALNENGEHSFSIVGPRLTRREDDGSIAVSTPNYLIVDSRDNIWKGTSDAAWVNKDGSIMKLEGKVDMHRLPAPKVEPVQLLTTDLTVLTDPKTGDPTQVRDRRMQTDALATVIEVDSIAHGVGMRADSNLKTVEFLADFHSIKQPGKR